MASTRFAECPPHLPHGPDNHADVQPDRDERAYRDPAGVRPQLHEVGPVEQRQAELREHQQVAHRPVPTQHAVVLPVQVGEAMVERVEPLGLVRLPRERADDTDVRQVLLHT